jgi:group I intron endonuclease
MRKKRFGIAKIYQKKSGVYRMNNLVTNDFYIGSSGNIYNRYYSHWNMLKDGDHPNSKIRNHALLHGRDSFDFQVLEYCDKQLMYDREQYYYDTLRPTYNAWTNVRNGTGFKQSLESIEKSVSKRKGRKFGREFRDKLKEAWARRREMPGYKDSIKHLDKTGTKHTAESKLKMSLSGKGRVFTEEHKEKIRKSRLNTEWDSINNTWIKKGVKNERI